MRSRVRRAAAQLQEVFLGTKLFPLFSAVPLAVATEHLRLGQVAKEASHMVLADENFSAIVSAVGEESSIYSSTKAFIRFGNRWFIRQEQQTLTIFADTIGSDTVMLKVLTLPAVTSLIKKPSNRRLCNLPATTPGLQPSPEAK